MRPRLSSAERSPLREELAAQSAFIGVPDVFMRAAAARHGGVATPPHVPRGLREERASPQWPLWLEALEKGYCGLLEKGVWDEDEQAVSPNGAKAVPTRLLFNTKKLDETYKARVVVRGGPTMEHEHCLEQQRHIRQRGADAAETWCMTSLCGLLDRLMITPRCLYSFTVGT